MRKGIVPGSIVLLTLIPAMPAFARGISLKDAGIGVWIFFIVAAVIILFQLIPAAILLFTFIGTATSITFGRKKRAEVESVPGYEPARVEERRS